MTNFGGARDLYFTPREFIDVFAWSYKDMPGIDQGIHEHKIPHYPDAKSIGQKLHWMKPEWALKIKEEV